MLPVLLGWVLLGPGSVAQTTQPPSTAPATQPAAGSLHAKLIGRWKVVSAAHNGQAVPPDMIRFSRVEFDADTMRARPLNQPDQIRVTRYRLDEGSTPAYIDAEPSDQQGRVYLGLIDRRDGRLHMVTNERSGGPRPTDFESKPPPSPNNVYMVLEPDQARQE